MSTFANNKQKYLQAKNDWHVEKSQSISTAIPLLSYSTTTKLYFYTPSTWSIRQFAVETKQKKP